MKNRQKVRVYLIVFLALLLLTSCAPRATQKIFVPYAGECTIRSRAMTLEDVKNRTTPDHYYAITVEEGDITASYFEASDTCILTLNNGYFLGVGMHMDGWVRHFPYYSTMPEAGETTLVLSEGATACLAYDAATGLLFTDMSGGVVLHENGIPQNNYGAVYLANSDGTVERLAETPWPASACALDEDGKTAWFVAGHQIYRIDENRKVTEVMSDARLYYLGACSLAVLDGKLYIGALGGFAVYDTQTKNPTWFPLE